jgi:hypothetical protein
MRFNEHEDRRLGEKAKELREATASLQRMRNRLAAEDEARRLGRWPRLELRVTKGGSDE